MDCLPREKAICETFNLMSNSVYLRLGHRTQRGTRLTVALALIFVGTNTLAATTNLSPGTLAWWAEVAKQKGLQQASFGGPSEDDADNLALDTARARFGFIIGTPVEQLTSADSNSRHIITWYKIRVQTVLKAPPPCAECSGADAVPAKLALSGNDIALELFGGTATINGVRLTENWGTKSLPSKDKTYLFVLRAGPNHGVYLAGPTSYVQVNQDGTFATAHDRNARLPNQILAQRTVDSLSKRITSGQSQ
jgi:hypothetical protein